MLLIRLHVLGNIMHILHHHILTQLLPVTRHFPGCKVRKLVYFLYGHV
jgi:hypothetical protein